MMWGLIAGILFMSSGSQAAPLSSCKIDGQFSQAIEKVLGKDRAMSSTSFMLAIVDTQTGATICQDSLQPDQVIYPASTIKTMIAAAALRKVDNGELKLADEYEITQSNAADECKDWDCNIYGPGKKVALKQLLWDMITVSNNLATNQLIDIVDRNEVNKAAVDLGAPSVHLYRKVYNYTDPEPNIKTRNTATASGYLTLLREIVSGKAHFFSEASRALYIDMLGHQKWNDKFNATFPKSVHYYHKTGSTAGSSPGSIGSTSDMGFYYLDADHQTAAVLIGLQLFWSFEETPAGPKILGNTTLSEIGAEALRITSAITSAVK